jgi:hypothetical protein
MASLKACAIFEFTALLLNKLHKQARENQELGRQHRELRSELTQVRAVVAQERTTFDNGLSAFGAVCAG